MVLVDFLGTSANIIAPLHKHCICRMLFEVFLQNIDYCRQSFPSFLDGYDPVASAACLPAKNTLELLVDCSRNISDTLIKLLIDLEVQEAAILGFRPITQGDV